MGHTLDRKVSPRSRITEDIDHIVPETGQSFDVHHLSPEFGGTAFKAVLFIPDEPSTTETTVYSYGVGANAVQYRQEAEAIAALGMPVALHNDPRKDPKLNLLKLATSSRSRSALKKHVQNPVLRSSQATERVMDAVDNLGQLSGNFKLKAHSKGGLPASMLAAHDERIKTVTFDGPAGFVLRNALFNHASSLGAIGKNVKEFMSYMNEYGPEDSMSESLGHVKSNPILLGREILFLVAKRPNVTPLLEEVQERGNTSVAVISHEHDAFFKDTDMQLAVEQLAARGLVHHHLRSLNTKHTNPMDNPIGSAHLYQEAVTQAETNSFLRAS